MKFRKTLSCFAATKETMPETEVGVKKVFGARLKLRQGSIGETNVDVLGEKLVPGDYVEIVDPKEAVPRYQKLKAEYDDEVAKSCFGHRFCGSAPMQPPEGEHEFQRYVAKVIRFKAKKAIVKIIGRAVEDFNSLFYAQFQCWERCFGLHIEVTAPHYLLNHSEAWAGRQVGWWKGGFQSGPRGIQIRDVQGKRNMRQLKEAVEDLTRQLSQNAEELKPSAEEVDYELVRKLEEEVKSLQKVIEKIKKSAPLSIRVMWKAGVSLED